MAVSARKAARRGRIPSYYEFATHRVATTLRPALAQELRQPVSFHEASLDMERGGAPYEERALVEYLADRHRSAPPDLIVAVAVPAMRAMFTRAAAGVLTAISDTLERKQKPWSF